MVVQSIALLDDLDKEINIYSMRVKVRISYDMQALNGYNRLLGMVWLAFPRDGQDPDRQRRVCEGSPSHGLPNECSNDLTRTYPP